MTSSNLKRLVAGALALCVIASAIIVLAWYMKPPANYTSKEWVLEIKFAAEDYYGRHGSWPKGLHELKSVNIDLQEIQRSHVEVSPEGNLRVMIIVPATGRTVWFELPSPATATPAGRPNPSVERSPSDG